MAKTGKRVLVAEDEFLIRTLMIEILEDAGFEVLEAANGIEACRLLDDPDHVDLLVTDLHMPGADGIAVAEHARSIRRNVPVVFVSARTELLAALSAPIPYRYLPKPFRLADLVDVVGQMLGRH